MRAAYFSHDEDARSDPKIIKIRAQYGMEGYGCYFAILEMMSSECDGALDYSPDSLAAIAFDLRATLDVQAFVDRCIEVGLFSTDGTKFFSEAFRRRCQEVRQKYAARTARSRAAAEARWGKSASSIPESAPMPHRTPEPTEDVQPCADPMPAETAYDQTRDALDADWSRVHAAYEQNIGLFPGGTACDKLVSYFNDLGADVLIEAINATSTAQPYNPYSYLTAILSRWAQQGVDTAEKARASTLDHDRKTMTRKRQEEPPDADAQPAIRGKFY